ncbi:hypothetical protein EDB85DRAFT_2156518 [Lactarius pseudohatsudake]|nr:hypothetical protein EDB85DRAFT_2156518 [Lactarius pseudohatsudake]
MRRRTLTSLPEELLVKIMEVGDGKTILACSNTCQTLRNVIANSSNLEYQLVLVSTGMRDSAGKDSPLLQIDRLRLLEKHEFSWRNLRWSESAAIPLLIGWQGPIAVSGDVLVFRRPHRGIDTARELLCLRTPSKLRGVDAGYWGLTLPAEARDICIDALQDLLIYQCLDSSLCVRKLSTGEPHPAVSHEGTVFPPDGWRSHPDSPRVCGAHVAVTSDQGLYISAWDWKSGAHVSEFLATAQQPSFEFLDENHIVFPGSDDRQLCVYNIQDFPSFRTKPSAIEQVRCCQVTIPPSGRPGLPKRIHFKCNTLSTGESAGGPFCMDPAQRLLVVQVTTPATQGGERGEETVELYLSVSALLSYVEAIRVPVVGQVTHPNPPDMARILRATAPHFVLPSAVHPSCFSVCGMRATFSRPTWHKGQLVLRVADFQAGRVARSHDLLPETPWRVTKVHPSEDVIEPDGGRRGGRIRQASRGNGVACGAGLAADEGSVCHTVGVKKVRPAQRYFERSVPLPWSMRADSGLSVSSVLCEDAILLFQLIPKRNTIADAYCYVF